MYLSVAVFVTFMGVSLAFASQGGVTPCGQDDDMIFCQNGSTCEQNIVADFSEYQLPDGTYHTVHTPKYTHHCICPDGWTGEVCNVPVESCRDGAHFCLHGGYCVPDGDYCDCSDAADDNGLRYVGKWCEHMEEQGLGCDDDLRFCLHDGVCNPDFPLISDMPCICIEEYDGPHCEYKVEQGLPPLDLCDEVGCENGGFCKLGKGKKLTEDYYFDDDDDDTDKNVYCECPKGFHGPRCEIKLCGDDRCHNGAQCLELIDSKTDEISYHCDCTTIGNDLIKFAGQYCQYKAEVNNGDMCTDPTSLHGHLFCVNGGQCNLEKPWLGCDCPNGFAGFACEYAIDNLNNDNEANNRDDVTEDYYTEPVIEEGSQEGNYADRDDDDDEYYAEPAINQGSEDDDAEDYYGEEDDYTGDVDDKPQDEDDSAKAYACNLECNGNGVCKKGAKDVDSLGIAAHGDNLGEAYTEDFEHCVCIPGYVGTQCEHQVEVCGESKDFNNPNHFCLHGGTCQGNSEVGYSCDCSSATSENPAYFLTGEHCQQPSISCYAVDSLLEGSPTSFCANGGICGDKIDANGEHPGCLCPKGWIGDFCEIWEESQSDYAAKYGVNVESDSRKMSKTVTIVLVACAAVIAAILAILRCTGARRPSPGFSGFGIRRRYSKKEGFRKSLVLNADKGVSAGFAENAENNRRLRRSWVSTEEVVDQSNNLAPYRDNHQSDTEGMETIEDDESVGDVV